MDFLNSPIANKVPNWEKQLQDVLDNVVQQRDESCEKNENPDQEEWMILSNYHKLNENFNTGDNRFDWHLDSRKYTTQNIGEMPNWIKVHKTDYTVPFAESEKSTYKYI